MTLRQWLERRRRERRPRQARDRIHDYLAWSEKFHAARRDGLSWGALAALQDIRTRSLRRLCAVIDVDVAAELGEDLPWQALVGDVQAGPVRPPADQAEAAARSVAEAAVAVLERATGRHFGLNAAEWLKWLWAPHG
jgi:hypothetical protein